MACRAAENVGRFKGLLVCEGWSPAHAAVGRGRRRSVGRITERRSALPPVFRCCHTRLSASFIVHPFRLGKAHELGRRHTIWRLRRA